MSQAIYYVEQSDKSTHSLIPKQAISIPLGRVLDKQTLLSSLAKACDFPSYFAYNWDSAEDCLTDTDTSHLVLDLADTEQINNKDLDLFKSIIEDAYRDFGKPQLWIVVASESK